MRKELIKLFKAVEIKDKTNFDLKTFRTDTIKYGFILDPQICTQYPKSEQDEIIRLVKNEYFTSGKQVNSSFHKSWGKIANASIEQLVIEQILHYFTTYGFEALGIFDSDSVYIPNEKLEIPELKEDIKLIVIKGLCNYEIINKVMNFVGSGIALKEETIQDLLVIWTGVGISSDCVEQVKNKELKLRLYDELNLVPKNNIEFVRYLIYKSIGSTLLIKDRKTIEMIKSCTVNCYKYFNIYIKNYGIEKLAEVFYRFKPIFLAFKNNDTRIRPIINKIRKLAVKHHKPIREDFLNTITAKIKNGSKISKTLFDTEVERLNIFRKIRLAYALKYRTLDPDSILYQIRNGKGFAQGFYIKADNKPKYERVYKYLLASIQKEIKENIGDKKVYIPENVVYTLPTTEKRFIGNFPEGSYLSFDNDNILIGVYWENQKSRRVDLDLSMRSINLKFGWDSSYRSYDRDILFSGDVTDARNGATEVFYIGSKYIENYNLALNDYTHIKGGVDYKFFIALQKVRNLEKNSLVDPNTILFSLNMHVDGSETIGMLSTDAESRFYFVKSIMDKSISSRNTEANKHAIQYMATFYKNCISLNEVLKDSLVDNKEDADIDLSIENLEKDSILNLLINKDPIV